jgi:ATP-binding cassette subfamily F protein 3
VIQLREAQLGYDQRPVLSGVNIEIRRGDHVAVVGLNGAGKSTLLKALAGTLAPLQGTRELGHQVELAIFNQHVVEVLDPAHTVWQSLEQAAGPLISAQEVRNMAGALLFSSDHIQKKISVLSGGEKSRVALGRILLQKVPFLLLDEPTNHLDFQTVEALTEALKSYTGTLAVVSHDRGFIRRVANRILEVSAGHVRLYPGTYDEYVWSLQKSLQAGEEPAEAALSTAPSRAVTPEKPGLIKKERDRKRRAAERRIQQIETELANLSARTAELNDRIASSASGDPAPLIAELSEKSSRIEALESEWLELEDLKE